MWSLLDYFPEDIRFNMLDAGAALTKEPPYQSLVDPGRAGIIGFEPHAEACERLNLVYGKPHRFFPYFVGDRGPAIFHETTWTQTGSLFAPNVSLIEKFQGLSEVATLVATHSVNTIRLNDVDGIADVDVVMIDVQGGAELGCWLYFSINRPDPACLTPHFPASGPQRIRSAAPAIPSALMRIAVSSSVTATNWAVSSSRTPSSVLAPLL